MSCMPTCSSVDGRFLLLVDGFAFQTLTTETLNIRIVIPGDDPDFTFGIFDGDSNSPVPSEKNWDVGVPYLVRYTLKIDPDMDDNGPVVFEEFSTNFPNNAWADFTLPTDDLARNADGDFVYTLTLTAIEQLNTNLPDLVSNAFKVRASGIVLVDEIFTFLSSSVFNPPATDPNDLQIIFPNYDPSDGVGPEDKVGANYDGTISFFFDVPEEAIELEFWDGDADRGNFDGTQTDTNDPNTPDTIPPFAPLSTDVVAQGVNPPEPFDDKEPDSDFNFMTLSPGAVSYLTIFPDGQVFDNINPSGNREWELWLISTLTDNPARADRMAPVIPAGQYEIRFQGLDINNFVSLRPLTSVVGEVIPDGEIPTVAVPTISEWGLIALAAFFGIIGVLYSRKYRQA
ncbi:MAG: hypothetical protein DHS20C13_02120 [Thermodesulfobacteriota bacterium]|nr:MAG: hypothetical protein DHS20C13_02120 [Thermodesulfobacteriota bacterium]